MHAHGKRPLATLVGLPAVVGVVAAVLATAFTSLVHGGEQLFWTWLPETLGLDGVPWWWVLLLLLVGAAGVAAATRLPGHGGHHPLDGFAFDITARELPSTLLAAASSLVFGVVLGPEAPLLAIGTSLGFAVHRRLGTDASRVLVMAAAAAALGVVLGNPVVTMLLVLEAMFLSSRPRPEQPLYQVVPILSALGAGYVVRIGIDDWPGTHVPELTMGDIGTYPALHVIDLVGGVVVALVAAGLIIAAMRGGSGARRLAARRPFVALIVGALTIGGLAVLTRAGTGVDVSTVLFSGQQSLSTVTASTAAGTLLVVAVVKSAAYSVSLGTGFHGGTIFPSVFIGATVGAAAALLVPGTALAPQVACGIAAGVAAAAGMPVTALVLALLLCVSAGPAVTVPAILGALVGTLLKGLLNARRPATVES
ncbi:chloride channel protein [Promicromonospora sp. MEB111]|uniref:chloride channel protein n=1 Tax=unclassified Promicromonospora TaxID=2647929 RepID=UPI00254AAC42|nr:chloride channel protein [Promicromonospora sp. MEB111]